MERKPTYIRAWREAGGKDRRPGGFTLDDMVGRLAELGVETTSATLSRVETGKVPYRQDLLEAIAEALGVSRTDLLENDPNVDGGEVIDMLYHMDARERARAAVLLRAAFDLDSKQA